MMIMMVPSDLKDYESIMHSYSSAVAYFTENT